MNLKNLLFVFLFAVVAVWAWQRSATSILHLFPQPTGGQDAHESARPTGRTLTIQDLPCFQCHIYARFAQEPAEGVFSHLLHVSFEYHCNQCHSFHGDRELVINRALCGRCHDELPEIHRL
ncbi:MAG TPA: cytochrome c3 family protein [bacterium]|jgi:hypothetical protein